METDTPAAQFVIAGKRESGVNAHNFHQGSRPSLVFAGVLDMLSRRAHRKAFPVLVGALALLATISMSVLLVPVLSAATLLNARRWKMIALCAALGSSAGALLLYVVFHHLGWVQLHTYLPELTRSAKWMAVERFTGSYGLPALLVIAASPLPQTPALVFVALAKLSPIGGVCGHLLWSLKAIVLLAFTLPRIMSKPGSQTVLCELSAERSTAVVDPHAAAADPQCEQAEPSIATLNNELAALRAHLAEDQDAASGRSQSTRGNSGESAGRQQNLVHSMKSRSASMPAGPMTCDTTTDTSD